MKRSEMVKLLAEHLVDIESIDSGDRAYVANHCLELIERAGMFYCPVEDWGEFSLRTPKGWEPEDEEK